jgi:hypothetical protein
MRTHLGGEQSSAKPFRLLHKSSGSDWGPEAWVKESNVLTRDSRRRYHFESRRSRGTKRRLGSTDDKNPRKTARGHTARCQICFSSLQLN